MSSFLRLATFSLLCISPLTAWATPKNTLKITSPISQSETFSMQGNWRAVTGSQRTKVYWTLSIDNRRRLVLIADPLAKGPLLLSGTYRLSQGKLHLVTDGKAEELGSVTWIDEDQFVVQGSRWILNFRRQG